MSEPSGATTPTTGRTVRAIELDRSALGRWVTVTDYQGEVRCGRLDRIKLHRDPGDRVILQIATQQRTERDEYYWWTYGSACYVDRDAPVEVGATAALPSSIADFLLARYTEYIAQCWQYAAVPGSTFVRDEYEALQLVVHQCQRVIDTHSSDDPAARLLADGILQQLASPYASHADYCPEWRL